MASELVKTKAIVLRIIPWSRTSHVVTWATPIGVVTTLVKGAVRAKSAFLGQYDLNYLCEMIYYARPSSEMTILKDVTCLERHDALRSDFRSLVLAEYLRHLVEKFCPLGPEAEGWFTFLERTLERFPAPNLLAEMLEIELSVLSLAGLSPDFTGCVEPWSPFYLEEGSFRGHSTRQMPVSPRVAQCLTHPLAEKNLTILLDAARLLGVYYNYHLEFPLNSRRTVLKLIANEKEKK